MRAPPDFGGNENSQAKLSKAGSGASKSEKLKKKKKTTKESTSSAVEKKQFTDLLNQVELTSSPEPIVKQKSKKLADSKQGTTR